MLFVEEVGEGDVFGIDEVLDDPGGPSTLLAQLFPPECLMDILT